jgi:hypothetical protein
MSLAEFLLAGRAYAKLMDPAGGPIAAAPSDETFDGMLVRAREVGLFAG